MSAGAALNLIALLAVLVGRAGVSESARHSAVNRRLHGLYSLVAALMALRLVAMVMPRAAPLVMVAAAWLPFMLVRLAEEMVRRHAPRALKFLVLGGGLIFSILAITLGLVWDSLAIALLAAFHVLSVAATISLLFKDKGELSIAERRAALLLSVALAVAGLIAVTDFKAIFPGFGVRGGPFAILLLLLATSRLATGRGRLVNLLYDVAIGFVAGAFMLVLTGIGDSMAAIPIAAVTAAFAIFGIVVERFNGLRTHGGGLIAAMTASGNSRAEIVGAHPLLEQGTVISASDLNDYPAAELERLSRHRLISPTVADSEPDLGAMMHDLLQRQSATHLLRLSIQPLSFLAVCADGFSQASLDTELGLVARLLESAE